MNFGYLKSIGCDPKYLKVWDEGWKLEPQNRLSDELKNHRSLDEVAERVHREYQRLEAKGKCTLFPPGEPKPDRLHVSPCAAVVTDKVYEAGGRVPEQVPWEEKTKLRIVLDLLRGGVNKELADVGVNFSSAEKAASMLTRNCWMWTIDLTDAFLNWRVHPDDTWMLGFYSPQTNQFGKHEYSMFGMPSAPGINDESVKEILRLLKEVEGISPEDFVDDLFYAEQDYEDAWDSLERAVRFLLKCGTPVSTKASGLRPPRQVQTWVGWEFDSILLQLRVPVPKVEKALVKTRSALDENREGKLSAKSFVKVVGFLSHVAEICSPGKRRLHSSWDLLNESGIQEMWQTNSRANVKLKMSKEVTRDLNWWMKTLERGQPFRAFSVSGSGYQLSCTTIYHLPATVA